MEFGKNKFINEWEEREMKKSIKRILAIMITVSSFSVLEPVKYSNIMTEKAYANSDVYLKSMSVTDGDEIQLNSSKKTYTTKVPNSSTTVIIRVTTNDKNDKVIIDGDSNPEKLSDKKYAKTVDLDKGINTFEIKVQDSNGENEREYTLKVDRGGKQSTDLNSVFLDNLSVDYGDLDFSKTTTSYDLNVDEDVEELRIQANPEDDNYKVSIDGINVDEDDKFRKSVKLLKGENQFLIDVEDDEDDENTKTYTLNVYRGKNPSGTSNLANSNIKFDDDQDEIYLDDLVLDDGDVKLAPNFNKRVTSYSVDVPETSEDIIVKGEPEYGSSIVKINGTTADSKNRKRVSLIKGKNVIEIQVNTDTDSSDNDYEKRLYKLTVYRGTSEGTSTANNSGSSLSTNNNSQNTVNSNVDSGHSNKWINVNGKWQYVDSMGNKLKNSWYFDKNYTKTYYFKDDNNMATGWLLNNNNWYYLDESGAMVTGWKQLGANWYYLDYDGKMKTGWLKDSNGNWYYLDSSGVMVTNTTVGGWKLGSSGALI